VGCGGALVFFATRIYRRERKVLCLVRGAVFEIGTLLRFGSLLERLRGGGYFFRFAGHRPQKGATSFRKKQIFFYAGHSWCCNVVRSHTMTGAVVAANASAPPHTGAKLVRG
jgi:hypothetical protein